MVTPDEIEHLNADDNKMLAKLEEHIDAELKAQRGYVQQQMWTSWSEGEEIRQRVWAELARRYMKAGWAVDVESRDGHGSRDIIIAHPLILFPHESGQ